MDNKKEFIDYLGIERFRLSEQLQSTLSRLTGGYSILSYLQKTRTNPDKDLTEIYFSKAQYYGSILNDFRSFETLEGMEQLLSKIQLEVIVLENLRSEAEYSIEQEKVDPVAF